MVKSVAFTNIFDFKHNRYTFYRPATNSIWEVLSDDDLERLVRVNPNLFHELRIERHPRALKSTEESYTTTLALVSDVGNKKTLVSAPVAEQENNAEPVTNESIKKIVHEELKLLFDERLITILEGIQNQPTLKPKEKNEPKKLPKKNVFVITNPQNATAVKTSLLENKLNEISQNDPASEETFHLLSQKELREQTLEKDPIVIVPLVMSTERLPDIPQLDTYLHSLPGSMKILLLLQYGEYEDSTPPIEMPATFKFRYFSLLFSEGGTVDCKRSKDNLRDLLTLLRSKEKKSFFSSYFNKV